MNNDEHRMIANMSIKRSNLGLGVLNGLLYAVTKYLNIFYFQFIKNVYYSFM